MFLGLLTRAVCVYWVALQRRCVGLTREIKLQTFGGDTLFTVKNVGVFKKETRRGQKRYLNTCTRGRNGVNLTLTFTTSTGDTTGMGSHDKKNLHKMWLTVAFNRSKIRLTWCVTGNWQTGLSSGTKILDIGKTVFEKDVPAVVLEISLTEKALIKDDIFRCIQMYIICTAQDYIISDAFYSR